MGQSDDIEVRKERCKDKVYSRKMKNKDLKLCQDSNSDGTGILGCYYWLDKDSFKSRRQCIDCYNDYMRKRASSNKEKINSYEQELDNADKEIKTQSKIIKDLNSKIRHYEEELKENKKQIKDLLLSLNELRNTSSDLSKLDLVDKLRQAKKSNDELKAKNEQLTEENENLNADLAMYMEPNTVIKTKQINKI